MGHPRRSPGLAAGAFLVACTLVGAAPAAGQGPSAGVAAAAGANDWSAPRTPWGHPDLQGVWTTDDEISVPVERPAPLGARDALTAEETASRTAQREAGLERGSGQTGDGPPHWYETATQASTRASFIVDPPDGASRTPSRASTSGTTATWAASRRVRSRDRRTSTSATGASRAGCRIPISRAPTTTGSRSSSTRTTWPSCTNGCTSIG